MNKRIKKLESEAWINYGYDNAKFIEKFAKLIIEECAKEIQYFVDQRIPASEYSGKLMSNLGLYDDIVQKHDDIRQQAEHLKNDRTKITDKIIEIPKNFPHIRVVREHRPYKDDYGSYTGVYYYDNRCPDCGKFWRE